MRPARRREVGRRDRASSARLTCVWRARARARQQHGERQPQDAEARGRPAAARGVGAIAGGLRSATEDPTPIASDVRRHASSVRSGCRPGSNSRRVAHAQHDAEQDQHPDQRRS